MRQDAVRFDAAPSRGQAAAAAEEATVKQIIVAGGGPDHLPRLDVLLAAEREAATPAATCVDEVAYWLYSSGTTGMPGDYRPSSWMAMRKASGLLNASP